MKKKPNPKPTTDDICIVCGRPYAMTHEVYFGNPNARLSQEWGMVTKLCYLHHQSTEQGVHHNINFDIALKQRYQEKFEQEHGHDKFMEVFKRNYL